VPKTETWVIIDCNKKLVHFGGTRTEARKKVKYGFDIWLENQTYKANLSSREIMKGLIQYKVTSGKRWGESGFDLFIVDTASVSMDLLKTIVSSDLKLEGVA
jgi:hypothetical protein